LRGRQWTNPQGETKYFNTLEVWSIFSENGNNTQNEGYSQPQPQPQVPATANAMSAAADIDGMDDSDDLPF
jgi:single-stranded DNA-binding protein